MDPSETENTVRDERARELPRALVRLLRSGMLSPEREARVLELHGAAIEALVARPESAD